MAKGISIRGVRNVNYLTGRLLGDLSAVTRGDIIGRVIRRVSGNYAGKGLQLFDKFI